MLPENAERRPSQSAARTSADEHVTSFVQSPTSIGDVLGTLFDGAVDAYYRAIDAERWDMVWRLADLIAAVHRCSEREAA